MIRILDFQNEVKILHDMFVEFDADSYRDIEAALARQIMEDDIHLRNTSEETAIKVFRQKAFNELMYMFEWTIAANLEREEENAEDTNAIYLNIALARDVQACIQTKEGLEVLKWNTSNDFFNEISAFARQGDQASETARKKFKSKLLSLQFGGVEAAISKGDDIYNVVKKKFDEDIDAYDFI